MAARLWETAASAASAPFTEPGMQSAFAAHGRSAAAIEELTWVLLALTGTTFIIVMLLVLLAIRRRPEWLRRRRTIIVGGFVFPVVVLSGLLVYGLSVEREIAALRTQPALTVAVIAEQFWWRVHYEDAAGVTASANEIRIPVGLPVELRLRTRDVIHSFWVPALAGKLDMIPGRENRLYVHATRPGLYRGQCAEYCGPQHARMAFYVVAMPAAEFRTWLAREQSSVIAPRTAAHARGLELFVRNCSACHAVRGTSAAGTIGPDLTHVGSRHSIGAGLYPNNIGTMAGWIASSQHLKPGNRMPSFRRFSGEELLDLSAYLANLQ